jgi:hypothetical protein
MKRMIWATLLTAVAFSALFGFVFPKNPEKYLRSQFFLKKTFAPAKYNLVVVGDSRIYRGISPVAMEEVLKKWKIINLGYSNGGLNPAMFRLSESKLASNKGPKAILLGITAFTLTPESLENKHYLENRFMKKEKSLELMYLGEILNWFTPVSPEIIKELLKGSKPNQTYINEYRELGWVASDKFPADTLEAFESYQNSFVFQKVTPSILEQIMLQVEKWSHNGIAVYAFRPPIPKAMIDLADTLAGYNENEIKVKLEMAGGHWIDVDPKQYKTYDGSHLNPESAVALSKFIATKIKQATKTD